MRDEQWVIQLDSGDTSTDLDENWVSKVNGELNKRSHTRSIESNRWKNQSIYRIPRNLKELCRSAYQPQTVSIGPYHHDEQQLEVMEEHKQRSLLAFLERSKKPLECYVHALMPVVEDLKNAYQELEPKWKHDNEAFLQLMIVDGCFVLEIMRIATAALTTPQESSSHRGYARNDPVFSKHGILCFIPYLKRGMLKLENQLPLLLLIKLLIVFDASSMVDGLPKRDKLTSDILKFFKQPYDEGNLKDYRSCHHILDLYRKSMLGPTSPKKGAMCHCLPKCNPKNKGPYITSVTKLIESGVHFKRSEMNNLNDISFSRGVLQLPVVNVDDALESNYLNLMAFERFHLDAGHDVRSYVCLMSFMINTASDVSLLQSCGIIKNGLGSDKVVANLFNSLSRVVVSEPYSRLEMLQDHLSNYCERPAPRWIAYVKHNYFTNPWVGLSVIATIFLFALAAIQTVYAVMDYHKSKRGK